ncbi:MAG: hypothetical protein KIT22_03095 [Verrucomicrobiae bacterium]|nr:hypothetical protein [Verrucomicrobiae bacterium]
MAACWCIPREVFRPAVLAGAHSIVVAHNHPSSVPCPARPMSDHPGSDPRRAIAQGRAARPHHHQASLPTVPRILFAEGTRAVLLLGVRCAA